MKSIQFPFIIVLDQINHAVIHVCHCYALLIGKFLEPNSFTSLFILLSRDKATLYKRACPSVGWSVGWSVIQGPLPGPPEAGALILNIGYTGLLTPLVAPCSCCYVYLLLRLYYLGN